jgi:hypothetical protein
MKIVDTLTVFMHPDKENRRVIRKVMIPKITSIGLIYHTECEYVTYTYYMNHNVLHLLVKLSELEGSIISEDSNTNDISLIESYIENELCRVFGSNIPTPYSARESSFDSQPDYMLSRFDYKHDLKIDKTQMGLYIKLLDKGHKSYRHHRKHREYPTSIYFKNKSSRINIYDKEQERLYKCPWLYSSSADVPEKFKVFRVEFQMWSRKLQYERRKYGTVNCLKNYYSLEDRNQYFEQYVRPIVFDGDYYKLSRAKTILKRYYNPRMSQKLYDFMSHIGSHGMESAKKKYTTTTYYSYKKKPKQVNVNPIPIPASWKGVSHLPNLLDLVYKDA